MKTDLEFVREARQYLLDNWEDSLTWGMSYFGPPRCLHDKFCSQVVFYPCFTTKQTIPIFERNYFFDFGTPEGRARILLGLERYIAKLEEQEVPKIENEEFAVV